MSIHLSSPFSFFERQRLSSSTPFPPLSLYSKINMFSVLWSNHSGFQFSDFLTFKRGADMKEFRASLLTLLFCVLPPAHSSTKVFYGNGELWWRQRWRQAATALFLADPRIFFEPFFSSSSSLHHLSDDELLDKVFFSLSFCREVTVELHVVAALCEYCSVFFFLNK